MAAFMIFLRFNHAKARAGEASRFANKYWAIASTVTTPLKSSKEKALYHYSKSWISKCFYKENDQGFQRDRAFQPPPASLGERFLVHLLCLLGCCLASLFQNKKKNKGPDLPTPPPPQKKVLLSQGNQRKIDFPPEKTPKKSKSQNFLQNSACAEWDSSLVRSKLFCAKSRPLDSPRLLLRGGSTGWPTTFKKW